MNFVRPTRWIILLALTMAASFAFGDTMLVKTDATTYIPPPRSLAVQHFIETDSLHADDSWSPPYGLSLTNANWRSHKGFAQVRFSERSRYGSKHVKKTSEPISVPEPSGLELLGAGLIGLAIAIRRPQI